MTVQIRSCSSKRVLPRRMASVIFHSIVQFDTSRTATQYSSRHTLRAYSSQCREEDGASVYANVCRTDHLLLALPCL
jgi:hypothetical protein